VYVMTRSSRLRVLSIAGIIVLMSFLASQAALAVPPSASTASQLATTSNGNSATLGRPVALGSSLTSLIYTFAGDGLVGYSGDSGPASVADLNQPNGTVMDSAGNLYIADTGNNVIRKVAAGTGIITTYAGNGIAGYSGDGGPATSAELNLPSGVALDSAGNLYISDDLNFAVRKVAAGTGIITTYAGNGTQGHTGDGGPATSAELGKLAGIAVDGAGNLYVVDQNSPDIRKVAASTGTISTYAGSGHGCSGYNGPATSAAMMAPWGLATDSAGNLYIADYGCDAIFKVTASNGVISIVAGIPDDTGENFGDTGDGGPATSAELNEPHGVAVDSAGNIYIADTYIGVIRKVTASSGDISTIAGGGDLLGDGGIGDGGAATSGGFGSAVGISVDQAGNLYIADTGENRIREVTAAGIPPTSQTTEPAFSVPEGSYSGPQTVSITDSTPGAAIYFTMDGTSATTVSPSYNGPINVSGAVTLQAIAVAPGYLTSTPVTSSYTITSQPVAIISTIAGNGTAGFSADGGAATSTSVGGPEDVAFDQLGNLYISDADNNVVWKMTPGTGVISVFAGNGSYGYSGDHGLATSAELNFPDGIVLDEAGNLYIADARNNVIRMVAANTGVITTIAGVYGSSGSFVNVGDGGLATAAHLSSPTALAVDGNGNLYIADTGNHRVRMISAASGIITTVAGNVTSGALGDGGPATSAWLNMPYALTIDTANNLYIVDPTTARVRMVAANTGIITTVAGNGDSGESGDGGLAINAEINPQGITVDSAGDIYISDFRNTVREVVASTGKIMTVAGNKWPGYSGDGGSATMAQICGPLGLSFDATGSLYIADSGNQRIRKVTFSSPAATPTFSLVSGSYFGSQSVTISDSIAGASIYYTTDGTTPSTDSNLYSEAIAVSSSETLQAIAVATGYTPSAVASASFTISPILSQTITFTDNLPATAPYSANLTYQISATGGGSGNPVTFTVSGPATLNNGTLTVTGMGAVTITADQAAGTGYSAASPATQSIQINSPVNSDPIIGNLSPAYASAGGAAFTLTVNGSAFSANSTVNWGSSSLATTYVSSSQLTAQVTASEIASAGITEITVQTPAPGGGTSSAMQFEVDSAGSGSTAPTITTVTATVTAGSPASYTVTLPSAVASATVSCLNLPAGASCNYSQGLLTIATSATTPAGTYQITAVFAETVTGAASANILLPILLLPLVFLRRRLAARGAWTAACLGLVLLAGAAIACVGCGGGGTASTSTPTPTTHIVSSSGTVNLTIN
jgi:sugar lactone lactonase YvrE